MVALFFNSFSSASQAAVFFFYIEEREKKREVGEGRTLSSRYNMGNNSNQFVCGGSTLSNGSQTCVSFITTVD